jgi:hypothetical protein
MSLPLEISINYKSNLTSSGADPYAKFYARLWYTYQGQNLYYDLIIDLDLVAGWKNATVTKSSITSYLIGYDLYLHLNDLRGDLFFDNIEVNHSSVNWARDPFCKDVNQGFTRNYYQIPKHWAAEIAPEGVTLESIYKDF